MVKASTLFAVGITTPLLREAVSSDIVSGHATNRSKQHSLGENYDEEEARMYLQASRAAFCDEGPIQRWDCGEICDAVPVRKGFVRVIPGKHYESQSYVAQLESAEKNHCLVAFRGSVKIMNWVADFTAYYESWPTDQSFPCEGCEVHAGFAKAYAELRDGVYAAITDLGCKSFVVAGHSYGAALGQLLTYELRAGGALVDRAYLYGPPRAGNDNFVAAFDALAAKQNVHPSAWLIVHHHDPVPRLCPRVWPFSYRFMPRQVYYNEPETSYKVCDANDGEDPTCSDSVPLIECISLDHVTYFNKSLMHTSLPTTCRVADVSNASILV